MSGKGPGIPLDGYENTVSSSLSEKYVKVLPEVHVDLIQPPERNTSEPPERIISEPPERIIKDFSEPPERNLPEKNALSDAADSPEKNAQEQPEGNVLSTFPSGRDVDIVHISSDVPLEHNIHIISNDEQKVPVDGQHMLRRPMALGKLVQMSAAVNKNPHQQSQKQYTKKITLSKKQQASQSLLYQHANTHRMASIRQDLFQLLGGFVPLAETLKDKKRLPMSNKTAGQLSQGKLDTQKNPDASAGVLQRGQVNYNLGNVLLKD